MAVTFLESFKPTSVSRAPGVPETQIEIGKPLLITIERFYTGNAPQKKLAIGKNKNIDLLITSSVKLGIGKFEASPKNVNFIREKVGDKQQVVESAEEDGTSVVFYTPALDTEQLVVSFTVMFDRFDQDAVRQISQMLSNASSLPVFATASGYLMGATSLLNIGAKIGSALIDGQPYLRDELKIDLTEDGTNNKIIVLYNDTDKAVFGNLKGAWKEDANGVKQAILVDAAGKEFQDGDKPYMLIKVSNKARPELDSFTPHAMSGAMLEKFYGEDANGKKIALDVAQEALSFYNDQQYLAKIRDQRKRIKDGKLSAEDKTKAEALIEAYLGNIQSEDFRTLGKAKK